MSEMPQLPDAACAEAHVDPEWFFPPPGGDTVRAVRQARRVCAECPLLTRRACLKYALDNKVDGIWAGTSGGQRKRLRKEYAIKPETMDMGRYANMVDGVPEPDWRFSWEGMGQLRRYQPKESA